MKHVQHGDLQYREYKIVLMKFEPCITLKLFLNLSDSELENSHKLYSYKNVWNAKCPGQS